MHVGTDPITGRRVDKSRTIRGAGPRARQKAMRDLLDQADSIRADWISPAADIGEHTVRELLEQWWWLRAPTWSPKTAYDHGRTIEAELLARQRGDLAGVDVTRLRTYDIDRTYVRMLGAGTTAATLEKAHRILRAALNQAVRWDWIARNPAVGATLPARHVAAIRPVELDKLRALMGSLEDDPDMAMAVRLALIAGQRRASVNALQWGDVDVGTGEIHFRRRVIVVPGSGLHVLPGNKTGREVRLAIDQVTTAMLTEHRRRRQELALAAGVGRLAPTSFVLARDAAGLDPWRPDTLSKRWRRLADRHGLTGVRIHDLRHTMISQLIGAGFDPAVVSERAGHSTKSITLDLYAHSLPVNDRAAAEHLGGIVDG